MSPRKKAKSRLSRPTKAHSATAVQREPTTGAWKEASPSPVLQAAAAEASKSSGSGLGHGSTSGQALVPTSAPVAEHPAAEQSPRKTHAALFKGTTTPGSNILRTIVRGPAKSEHSKKEHKEPSPAKNSAPSTPPEAPSVRPAPTPSSTLRAFEGVVSFFGLRSKGTSHVPTPQAEPAAKDEDLSVCLLPEEEVKEAQALWQTTCKLREMGFETLLSKGSQLRVTGRKALPMYRACMDAERMGSTDDTGMADLKAFMRERRIPWPGEPDARTNYYCNWSPTRFGKEAGSASTSFTAPRVRFTVRSISGISFTRRRRLWT
ncbi:uncharacterized protein LOC144108491 [Amblyomma americanum]